MGIDHLEGLNLPQLIHQGQCLVLFLHTLDGHSLPGLDVLSLQHLGECPFSFAPDQFILF